MKLISFLVASNKHFLSMLIFDDFWYMRHLTIAHSFAQACRRRGCKASCHRCWWGWAWGGWATRGAQWFPPMKGECYLRAPLESQSTNPNEQLIISWFILFVWFMLFIDCCRIQIMRNKYWEHVCECCKCCVASKKCGGLVKAFDVVVQRHLVCLWTFMQRRSSWSCGAQMSRWFYAWTP